MKKRTFLKLSSAMVGTTLLSPLISWGQRERLHNWAGNIQYSTDRVYPAESVEQVRELVKKYDKLKVLGTRHCFNTIADSKDNLISVRHLDQVLALDVAAKTVTIGSGITYGQLGPYLHAKGFALHNLASLPHISVAGACTTATHGSGVRNGNLATAVVALEFISAGGDIVELSKEKDGQQFNAAVVSLGALGVLTQLTLRVEPTYLIRQDVYQNLPMGALKDHFEQIVSSGYSVSIFTDWKNDNCSEVWIKSRVDEGSPSGQSPDFFGASKATKNLHPISELSAENCTEQMGVPGPWFERLPHFRMGFTPSSGKELQSEYFVPREHAVEAILSIARLHEQISPHLMISEIRTIAADDLWMSPCYKQDCVTLHFTWIQDWPAVSELLPIIEKQLEPFGAKPHWGKLFTMTAPKLRAKYIKLDDFLAVVRKYDPKGKFRNPFLNEHVFGI